MKKLVIRFYSAGHTQIRHPDQSVAYHQERKLVIDRWPEILVITGFESISCWPSILCTALALDLDIHDMMNVCCEHMN
jgi:hypothetical protein